VDGWATCSFYNTEKWLADPAMLLRIWEGGMSFHGGLIGVAIAIFIYARKHRLSFLSPDRLCRAPGACTGLFFGRIGNFIGQELYGRPTDVPWAYVVSLRSNPAALGTRRSSMRHCA